MAKNVLIEYLEQIFKLEKSVLAQQNYMKKVNQLFHDVNNTKLYQEKKMHTESEGGNGIILFAAFMGGLILFAIVLCILVFAKQDIKYYPQILFVCMAFTFLLGVINISKENHEIDDENKRIENNNRHIREKNEKVKYWIKEETEALQNEYNKLSRKLEETQDTLLQMYSLDVIFPKYRNIIAVSSFYEYLLSGRCDKLEGAEGAYNIFESELRMNLIINKIDDVIKHLEKIEQHQYMLYSAIQENNKQVNQLSGELTMLVNNSCQIEENTRMTEYYAWISARNTEAVKWKELGLL